MWLAIRYRRLQALVLLVLSALITACVVVAPLYDRAMQQALTRLTIDAATSSATAIQVRSVSRFAFSEDADVEPASPGELAGLLPEAARRWFGQHIDGASVFVVRADQTARSPVGALQWRTGACEHVTWVAGACPQGIGEIAVSAADVKNYGLSVGSTVDVVEQLAADPPGRRPTVPLRVTGVYRQVGGPYWTDEVLAGVSGSVGTAAPYRPLHDAWLTSAATFTGTPWLDPQNSVTFPLQRQAVGVDELARAGAVVSGMSEAARVRVDDQGYRLNGSGAVLADVQSGLPQLGATIDRGRRQALVTVPLLMSQLGLLALFVLVLTLGAAVEQRRPEVGVARLRGAGRAGARRLVLAELLPVVLAGVPVGVAAALGMSAVARHTVLAGAAPDELGRGFWLAIAAAVLLVSAVTWATTASGTRDRISSLLRTMPVRTPGWRPGVVDAVVIAGAGTAVLLFVTGDLDGPLALAAPALLALVAGLALAHLIVPVATWAGRRLTARGRYASALAMLAVARRPATRRVVTVVTVASALLVFSSYAVSVGARNRELVAQRETGAVTVADLTGTDFAWVRSVLTAAGDGHATPVVRMDVSETAFRTTLAVDPEAFGRIALFPDSDPGAVPWSSLRVPTGRRLALTGRAVSLLATPARFQVTDAGQVASLQLALLDADGNQRTIDLGPIPTGAPARLGAEVSCLAGCTVVGFSVSVRYGAGYGGQVTISDVRVAGGSTDLPGTVADWRPGVDRLTRIDPGAAATGALVLRVAGDGRATPVLTSRWFPTPLAAVVVGRDSGSSGGTVIGSGLSGTDRTMTRVAALPRAPSVDGAAAVVDLDMLTHWGTRTGRSARIQAWLDTEDPATLDRVRTALDRAGIEISGVRRLSAVHASYDASVPAWSLQLGVLAAVAGLLLAALVLVLLVVSTWRRRTRDLACLGLSGVPRRGLRRIAVGEQLPTVLLAVLAGAGCGVLGAVFALPTVPLFAEPRSVSTLDISTPWPVVLVVLAVALIVLAVITWLCGIRVAAAGDRLSRVRETL
jgi:putative ABC transport system permease protein